MCGSGSKSGVEISGEEKSREGLVLEEGTLHGRVVWIPKGYTNTRIE